jgi:regulator of protease activity HflC (stomatin/prohibitin superfamily)
MKNIMPYPEMLSLIAWGIVFLVVLYQLISSLRIVPQRYAMIVERLGRYHMTLNSGFHILIPFLDKVVATLDLKEESVDVPPQECFTQDEIKVIVDGVMYISVVDPVKAFYGITNYRWGAMQLAQTTTRSIIGKLTLDKTFEERQIISSKVVDVLEQTSSEWGIQFHRYEIKNLQPPSSVQHSMEKQVTAERERRAIVAKADGEKQSRINKSEGYKLEMINTSEGEKQRRINEAQGKAKEITAIAEATAESVRKIGAAIHTQGGKEAVKLKLAEQYIKQVANIANENTEVVVPMDISKVDNILKAISPSKES